MLLPLALLVTSVFASTPSDLSVDLHSHLFMKTGLSWWFTGEFEGPLRARDWRSRFSSQSNAEALARSGLGVVVVSLYAHPILAPNKREAIREQIRQAERFVASDPRWAIARSPQEAREALARGQRVLVLALEGADGVLETEADLREFVDERGIRIVTLLHLVDNELGGVAFLPHLQMLGNPIALLSRIAHRDRDESGVPLNARGLTEKGREVARALLRHRVWIDLAHASERSTADVLPLLREAGQPPLYTHGALRDLRHAERDIPGALLEEIRARGGILGLAPSEDFVGSTRGAGHEGCPRRGGLSAFARHYEGAVRVLGAARVMLGSDFNGAIPHLRPGCVTGTSIDREGLWNEGQVGELWQALRAIGAPVPERLTDQVDAFLAAWERVMNSSAR